MTWERKILAVYLVVFAVVGLSFVFGGSFAQILWPVVTNGGLLFLAWSAWRKRKRSTSEHFDMTLVGETLISTGIMFVVLGLGVAFAVFMKIGTLTVQSASYFILPAFEGLISSGMSYGLTVILRNKEVRLLEEEERRGVRHGIDGLDILRDTAIGHELTNVVANLEAAGAASVKLKDVLDANADKQLETLKRLEELYGALGKVLQSVQRFFGDSLPGGASSGGHGFHDPGDPHA
ncbi:hypothetical protein KJ903_04285 [Patescibacteria group bacterium]|nr:hypothetical protein [Patescibacteria group bacterium]